MLKLGGGPLTPEKRQASPLCGVIEMMDKGTELRLKGAARSKGRGGLWVSALVAKGAPSTEPLGIGNPDWRKRTGAEGSRGDSSGGKKGPVKEQDHKNLSKPPVWNRGRKGSVARGSEDADRTQGKLRATPTSSPV